MDKPLTDRPFYCALSRKIGKRPIFLAAILFAIIGNAVCQTAKDYNTLLAGRVIQGLSTSPFESVLVAVVGYYFPFADLVLTAVICTLSINEDSGLLFLISS